MWLLWTNTFELPARYDKNSVVRSVPMQYETVKKPFNHKGFTIKPVFRFEAEGRLLSKRRYLFGASAKLSPYDYALGWGPMSTHRVLKDLKIWQWSRWYFYRYKEAPLLPQDMRLNSSNMHLIPANKLIAKKIKKVRKGKIVKIKGYLVNVSRANGWNWSTSTRRDDTGNQACEIVWVEDIVVQ